MIQTANSAEEKLNKYVLNQRKIALGTGNDYFRLSGSTLVWLSTPFTVMNKKWDVPEWMHPIFGARDGTFVKTNFLIKNTCTQVFNNHSICFSSPQKV